MSALALAQAHALAELVAAESSEGGRGSAAAGSSSGGAAFPPGQTHVTGLDARAHADAFRARGAPTQHAAQQPSDYSALLLEEWLDEYRRERDTFTSTSLFCEIKLRELIELTNTLQVGAADQGATADTARSTPSKLRTAVCIDLLDILIASVVRPGSGEAVGGSDGPASSRAALGHLLLRLRDELLKSIYVQPLPAHLFLQYTPYFAKTPLPPSSSSNGQMVRRGAYAGSMTQRSRARGSMEEKTSADDRRLGSSTHRGRLVSTARPSSSSNGSVNNSGPPSVLSALLGCTEWFSLIPAHVDRNRRLAEQARIIMIPSKLFRLRQIQKKVVGNMTSKWRELLLKWKFWEWRAICVQKREDRARDRASKVATRVTDAMALLATKVAFLQWRQLVVHRKYRLTRDAKSKGLATNAELVADTLRLHEETHLIREESARLDASNAALAGELKALRAKLEHSQVDLQDTSKHQAQCGELLDALRAPLSAVFTAIGAQIDAFGSREFSGVHALLQTVVDPEFQAQLDPLGLPATAGLEHWALCISTGTPKQRIAVCAELVARWIALQLRLAGAVLSGGPGTYSAYLVKLENQQRLAAALARVRQLCSATPPTTLPSFPVLTKRALAAAAAAAAAAASANSALKSTPSSPGGTPLPGSPAGLLSPGRTRTRVLPPAAIAAAAAAAAAATTAGDSLKDTEDASSEDGKGAAARASGLPPRATRAGVVLRKMGKMDELPPAPPGSEQASRARRLAEGQAIPTGTLSTPARVFAQLRDQDRPETVFAVSSVLLHADTEIARSLRVPPERRWTDHERARVGAMREVLDSFRVTADMPVADMDAAVDTTHDGVEAARSAMSRARGAQARLEAVEDEVFAQSVKLLHQQSQRKHRHGERENNMPTDMLDLDLSLYSDVLDASSLSKYELLDANKVFEEYCRDLYKIFVYYCQGGGSGGAHATSMLVGATQTEPRMGNGEFWRFVRDCKLKLQQTALIDLVFLRVADRGLGDDLPPSSSRVGSIGSLSGIGSVSGTPSTASLLANMPDGMSLIETEALAERARQAESASKDIGFRQFGETLVRLALAKFPSEKLLARKLKSLLLIHVLPNASAKALAFHKAQLAAAQTLAAASTFSNTPTAGGPTAVANLSTVEVDAVFRKHNPLLRQVFQIYARITPNFMTMTFNDFLGFAREFELLHKYVTQHDLKQLFGNVIRDMATNTGPGDSATGTNGNEVVNLTGVGAPSTVSTGNTPTLAAALEKAGKAAVKRVLSIDDVGASGGAATSGSTGAEDDRDAAAAKELSYRQFLELLAAVSHYVIRNPYLALHDRVDKFINTVLASRKKLPAKVYRSAV